jgi:hypothetical protein
MLNPWVSLRCDQLIPVNKAVNEKEQLEKGLEEEDKKMYGMPHLMKTASNCAGCLGGLRLHTLHTYICTENI